MNLVAHSKASCLLLSLALTPALWAQSVTGFPSVPLKDRRPAIGADYPGLRLRPETQRILLDGQDVTNLCAIGGTRMSLEPGWDLNYGGHRVQFLATSYTGQRVENSWNFSIQAPQLKTYYTPSWNNTSIPNLSLQQKFPQGMVSSTRPEVGARFQGQFQSVRLMVDGQDQTYAANRTANSIIWQPQYNVDAGTHNVMVDATGIHGHRVVENWSFQVPGNNSGFQPGQPLEITRYWPQPGGFQSPRSKLGADFNENVSMVRLFADGQELTNQSSISGNGIRWVPQSDLTPGNHNLRVVARGLSGQQLTKDWSFQVAARQQAYAPTYVPTKPDWPANGNVSTFPNGPSGPRTPIGVTLPSNGTNYDYFQLMLDGRDITPYAHKDGQTYYFAPDYNLQQGLHQINFSAWNRRGARVDQSWNVMIQ